MNDRFMYTVEIPLTVASLRGPPGNSPFIQNIALFYCQRSPTLILTTVLWSLLLKFLFYQYVLSIYLKRRNITPLKKQVSCYVRFIAMFITAVCVLFLTMLPSYLPITVTSLQWPLSTVPKEAVVERSDCSFF